MSQLPDLKIIDVISRDFKNANVIFLDLLHKFQEYLGIKPKIKEFQFFLVDNLADKNVDFYKFGTIQEKKDGLLKIKINKKYLRFLPFIFLREILKCFLEEELRNNISLNLAINQIMMTILSKNPYLNEWKSIIHKNIQQISLEAAGFNFISNFDRLDRFFNEQMLKFNPNPIQFFFQYLIDHPDLVRSKYNSFNFIFFKKYKEKLLNLMTSNPLVESLYSIITIFLEIKNYKNLLQYKKYFQSFKEQGLLKTELSLRKFTENMELIKKTFISPSFLINWRAINIEVIVFVMKFNPILDYTKITKVIKSFPFINSPKVSLEDFSNTIFGYLILPLKYFDDIIKLMEYLKKNNYLIEYSFFSRIYQKQRVNLNYFKEGFTNQIIPNPNYQEYEQKYETKVEFEYTEQSVNENLSILDFLILDRIRWFSFSGLGFERRDESIKILKSDLFDEIISQRSLISNLKVNLKELYKESEIRTEVITLINKYKEGGFFFLKTVLEIYLDVIKDLENIIKNKEIQNCDEINDFLSNYFPSTTIEHNLIFKTNKQQIEFIIKNLFTSYFNSKPVFLRKVKVFKYCSNLLDICSSLKLFDLNILIDILINEKLAFNIFQAKDKILREKYEEYQIQDITSDIFDNSIENYIVNKPPIIAPILINTIITTKFERDYFQLLISNYNEIEKDISKIANIFPRILINKLRDLKTKKNLYHIEISVPALIKKEKNLFISIIFNIFEKNLIYGKNHLWSGFITGFSTRNFYDYENQDFFYTKDLYEQYGKYIESSFQDLNQDFKMVKFENQKILWSDDGDIIKLVKLANNRKARENEIYDHDLLDRLRTFYLNMEEIILRSEEFVKSKKDLFFQNHVKAIKFIPAFQRFNLSKFTTYFYSSDLNQINFKSLLGTNFLKIEYPASIDDSIPFLIDYVLSSNQSDNPILDNILAPENKIREYCGFVIKKTHALFHFEMNFTPEGWDYDSIMFKEHLQNVLFNKEYKFNIPNLKTFQFSDNGEEPKYGLSSPEFQDLCEIYDYRSIDIKSYIGTKKVKTVERIQTLLKKELIFPYITLKNLGFQESIYLIIPDLNQDSVNTIIKIFGWFNYGFIYEIEGKYFIYGFDEPVEFTHGLMMKIYFPKCELSEFKQLFDMIFEYLQVDHYLILKDFVNGDTLVKNIHEDPNFFKKHHPLRNVKYDGKDV